MMGDKDNGGPAFPTVAGNMVYSNGMTLRDWFAGHALAGICATDTADTVEKYAKCAYMLADAMIEARK